MNNQQNSTPSKIGIQCAKYSFLIGTFLFLAHLAIRSDFIIMTGLFYVILALLLNLVVLLILLFNLIHPNESRLRILMAIGLMLLNIPIAIGYLHFI